MNLEQLKNRKVTMFGLSEFGFPVTRQTTVREATRNGRYVELIHKPKRKRRWFKKTVQPSEEIYVFDGWIEINAEMYTETSSNGHRMSKQCFSEEYTTDALKSAGQEPLMIINQRSDVL